LLLESSGTLKFLQNVKVFLVSLINTIPQFTAQLVGDWRENSNAVKVLPAESGDKAVADIRSDLIRSIETSSEQTVYMTMLSRAWFSAVTELFRVGVQYTSDDVFDQEIVLNPIDDCSFSSLGPTQLLTLQASDATHCFVDDQCLGKSSKDVFPDANPVTL
jgi:hypothetical protein